jgi:hypothetical protein
VHSLALAAIGQSALSRSRGDRAKCTLGAMHARALAAIGQNARSRYWRSGKMHARIYISFTLSGVIGQNARSRFAAIGQNARSRFAAIGQNARSRFAAIGQNARSRPISSKHARAPKSSKHPLLSRLPSAERSGKMHARSCGDRAKCTLALASSYVRRLFGSVSASALWAH